MGKEKGEGSNRQRRLEGRAAPSARCHPHRFRVRVRVRSRAVTVHKSSEKIRRHHINSKYPAYRRVSRSYTGVRDLDAMDVPPQKLWFDVDIFCRRSCVSISERSDGRVTTQLHFNFSAIISACPMALREISVVQDVDPHRGNKIGTRVYRKTPDPIKA